MNVLKLSARNSAPATASRIGIFRTVRTNSANQFTYTFTNVPLGPPRTGRLIVVIFYGNSSTGEVHNVTGVTVAGNAATLVVGGVDTVQATAIYQIVDSTNTSTTITATVSPNDTFRAAIAVYAIYGLTSTTPEASGIVASVSGVASQTLSGTAGGILIAGACSTITTSSTEYTWVGATREFFTTTESALASGSALNNNCAASQTVQITPTPGYAYRMVAARWY